MGAPARRPQALEDVVERFLRGDARALARALTWVEDGDPRGRAVLGRVYERTGRARVLGVTGSPGAGKSTLVDQLVTRMAAAGRKVAIVAVDPSSAFSGGAILGDRIRMRAAGEVPGVFIRSMATRGHLGGLARATDDAVDLLDAFGFDDVLIETVGVGQDEIEVVRLAQVNLVVLVPFMGDDVQAIKAGIMEIADAYVINKADRDGADRLEAQLRYVMQLYEGEEKDVPIRRTVATQGEGVDELLETVDELARAQQGEGAASRRERRVQERLTRLLRDTLLQEFHEAEGAADGLAQAAARVAERQIDPHAAIDELRRARRGAGVRLDHLGVAVADPEAALAFWRDGLGLSVGHREEVASERVTVTMLPVGSSRVELLEPLAGDGGPVGAFLDKRGGGIHHVCLEVADIEAALGRLRAAGAQLVGEAPRPGAGGRLVAFVHPRSTGGVLVELSQPAAGGPDS
jgi:LAO/AO transport system kinase